MKSIEENSERLDLIQKTYLLEQKQKKRLLDLAIQKEREIAEANQKKLYDGTTSSNSLLDQEDAHRKELFQAMNNSSTTALTPVIRVLNNFQGKLIFNYLIRYAPKSITF